MACGGHGYGYGTGGGGGTSVASLSVVSKDSIFDKVLREENERLSAMGMGRRDNDNNNSGSNSSSNSSSSLDKKNSGVDECVGGDDGGTTKDKMRGGRRVEI